MRRGLFGKKFSVQEIEAEVTEQIETMVRSGKNPPPASWTLLGGLPVEDAAESSAPPATAPRADDALIGATDAAEVVEVVEVVEIEEPQSEPEAAAEEPQTVAPPRKPGAKAPRAATPTKGARAAAGAKTTKARTASPGARAAGSTSASTRARSTKSGRVSASPASRRSRS